MSARIEAIRAALSEALAPQVLEVVDESHLHVGHAGARDGRGHFAVVVISDRFAGLPLLARHRSIYRALGGLMDTDIHALSVRTAKTPEEAGSSGR